jgi:cytochrome P450
MSLSDEVKRYAAFSPDLMADPYPLYHRLRDEDPVHWNEAMGGWMLTRHADVIVGFRDARLSVDRMPAFMGSLTDAERESVETLKLQQESMLSTLGGAEHTRLRALISKAFTPRVVEDIRARVESLVDELISGVEGRSEMDLIADPAFPLPAIVISEGVGIPPSDRVQVKRWADDFAEFQTASRAIHERALKAQRSLEELRQYVEEIVELRRDEPRDDLISGLMAAEQDGDRLTAEELVSTVALLLIAGNETTTNLITNGILALIRNPDQIEVLKSQPELNESTALAVSSASASSG